MRIHLLGLILLAGVAAPAAAQRDAVERRVDRLEQEMRAVQRRVFPGGGSPGMIEPELRPQQPAGPGGGSLQAGAIDSLSARVDALEAQLRVLTGQSEENGFRLQQLERQLLRVQGDLERRIDQLGQAQTAAAAPASTGDAAQDAYNAGFRLWEQRRFEEAAQALEAVARDHPRSRWASWARNLAGRAYLDDSKPATAARILLENYQTDPRGERAADSLYFLGQSLTRLNRRQEACRVYDELEEVYPNMRDFLRTRLPQARTDARCTAAPAPAPARR